jgi:NADH-quinone oxidoreductase subunit M
VLAVINIIYGALVAMAQTDLKKLVAYSSVSHMGYVLLGMAAMTPVGYNGAILQMFNHGVITGALFLLVGVLYDRAHTREINAFGGLASKLPVYTGVMSLAIFASLGLPGLAGFVSEFMVFVGSYPVFKTAVIFGVIGVVLTAGYLLWTLQRMFLGGFNEKWTGLTDMSLREHVTLVPLGVVMVFVGLYPKPVIDLMNFTLTAMSKAITG